MTNKNKEKIDNIEEDMDQFENVGGSANDKEKVPLSFLVQWPVIQLGNTLSNMVSGYKKLFKMRPSDLKSMYLKQAKAMNQKGNITQCINFLEQIVIIDNKDYDIIYKLGVAYEKDNQNKRAARAYQRVITLKPDFAKAHYRKALLLIRNKEYADALTALEKAVELEPDSAEIHFRLGQTNDRLKKYQKAIDCFNKAVEINPEFLAVYKNMALTYDSMDNHKESLRCLKYALDIEEF
ncbi:MAG: magnetosome protein MamA [Thermodesulfobacteriota bacterium]|nr:magnetosome protein MamA [Thermodesulfobacteriota bacterium]